MDGINDLYRHYKYLYGYVFSLCQHKETTEDIVQDTFVKAIININKFRGDCKIEVWLCQIAKNLYISHTRKKDNQNQSLLEEVQHRDGKEDFVLSMENRDMAKRIAKILHQLPEPYKEVFSLHVYGEIPLVDIAEIFGKSVSWAGVTFHRAKQKIWEKLKEDGYE